MSHLMDSAGVAGLLSSISQHGALQTLEDANIFGTLENDGKNLKNKRSVSALVQPGDKGLQDWTAPKFATRCKSWKYFLVHPAYPKVVRCQLCSDQSTSEGFVSRIDSSTSKMSDHLRSHHLREYSMIYPHSTELSGVVETVTTGELRESFLSKLADFVTENNIESSVIQSSSFKQLVAVLSKSKYEVPSATELESLIQSKKSVPIPSKKKKDTSGDNL